MKLQTIVIGGIEYYICYNGAAMFTIRDICGDDIFAAVTASTAAGFSTFCGILAALAEQGELVRRYMGHDKHPIPTTDMLTVMISAADVPKLRAAVLEAVIAGLKRDVESEDEVDEGLAEIEKKTGIV